MKNRLRNLILWIAIVGSFTVSMVEPTLRLPAMFFVFVGITVMILRWRRRNPDAGKAGSEQSRSGRT